ncbi:ABC multidrug transporter [Myxozyma melibiosi]|uniref:ABC multidrug transporter n=1 Tax=Myxozyma melibiosi TaxID=54550 RepID=A0ABR1F0P9_9ASCO
MSPEEGCSFMSKLLFGWMNEVMSIGYSRPIQENDIPLVPPSRTAHAMTEKFLENFRKRCAEVEAASASGQKGKLVRIKEKSLVFLALHDTFKFDFWAGFVHRNVVDIVQMTSPQLSRKVIYWVSDKYVYGTGNKGRGIGYVIGLVAMLIVACFCQQQYFYATSRFGSHSRTVLINALYQKSLVLSNKERLEFTNGKITNLMSTDTYRIEFASMFFHHLSNFPVPIIICVVLLLVNIGYPSLVGIALLFGAMPFLAIATRTIALRRIKSTIFTDQRIRLTQELLTSMRVVKLFAWENAYLQKLATVRLKEIKIVRYLLTLRSGLFAVSMTVPIFSSMIAFVVLSVTGHLMDAAKVFASLSLFNMLRMPLMLIPIALSTSSDAYVACGRIQAMLVAGELEDAITADESLDCALLVERASFMWEEDPEAYQRRIEEEKIAAEKRKKEVPRAGPPGFGPPPGGPPGKKNKKEKEKKKAGGGRRRGFWSRKSKKTTDPEKELEENANALSRVVSIESAHVIGADADADEERANLDELIEEDDGGNEDTGDKFTGLHDIDFRIERGELIVITGFIGSGKTSLLASLVGEMRQTGGSVKIGGKIAYCPQPWIQNSTLRENILFGREYDEDKYKQILKACALEHDVEVLPAGDQTEIGERGINISGGQKARISLARAAYFESDIVILDDVLSAVDPHVGRTLVDGCICGLLGGKTRLLATHQLHVLPKADRIIYMNGKGGCVIGTYEELKASVPEFAELTTYGSVQKNEEEEEEEEKEEEELPPQVLVKAAEVEDEAAEVEDGEEATEAAAAKTKKAGKLMRKEERNTDSVSFEVYREYFKLAGGPVLGWGVAPLVTAFAGLVAGLQIVTNLWLSYWTSDRFDRSNGFYIGIYVMLGMVCTIFFFLLGWATTIAGSRASVKMNLKATEKVMSAPMSFFDTNPIGRIINRFSNDVESMDNTLTDAYRQYLISVTNIIGVLVLIIAYLYWFAIALVPMVALYILSTAYYRASAVELKRLDSNSRSTVFSHFSETLTGLTSVRAYNEQERFKARMEKQLDYMNRFSFMILGNQRWLSVRIESIAVALVLIVGLLAILVHFSSLSASSIGLVLSYCITLAMQLAMVIKQLADVENHMNAAERVYHYMAKLPSEAPYEIPETKPAESWPEKGAIEIKDVYLRYRPGLPYVLKGLSLSIQGGEKVGICGRTGAGKSSIMVALYRLAEISKGQFLIDGVDISKIGLHDLRSKLAIIPQDPVLFRGTIRSNLDPFNHYSDAQLWDALRRSGLLGDADSADEYNEKNGQQGGQGIGKFHLDQAVDDEGLNFSLGERQLLALARALVRNFQILVLDEATSSVDYQTDAKIQQVIVREFSHCTILCIAHRLKTIIGYDKILVLDGGKVAEFGPPRELFGMDDGIFRAMCTKSGIQDEDFEVARRLL